MRRLLLLFTFSTICTLSCLCDEPESFDEYKKRVKTEFETYKNQKRTEFEQYRQRLNEEFAARLSGEWKDRKTEPKKELPSRPKPSNPIEADKTKPTTPQKVPVKSVVTPEKPIPDIPVTIPKIESKRPATQYPISFNFYNTPCGIRKFDTSLINITSTDNASISKAWKKLTANENLEPLLDDCLRLREEMQLCDWAFLQLADKVASTLYPNSPDNKTFLTTALLIQAGYDCRILVKNGKLALGFHPSHQIYGKGYTITDGKSYFIYGPLSDDEGMVMTYNGDFKKSPTPIRMVVDRYPQFSMSNEKQRIYSSDSWKSAPPFEVGVNKSVIDFFDSYPIVDWNLYGMTPVSPQVKNSVIPVMKILTEDLDEEKAVNLILSYLNFGFHYMTDEDQFGREKPFFPDENFYYPYNDCEDRAILFSQIVKGVLGLDVVYLHYPNHLAAAVRFSPGVNVKGATVDVDGVPYVVCDPTCMRSYAGYLPSQFSNEAAKIYKIKL